MGTFEWESIESTAAQQLITAVKAVLVQYPDERIYGAMFHEFYGDGSVIYWPQVTVGTEESLARARTAYRESHCDGDVADLRWSGSDLPHTTDPDSDAQEWAERCQKYAGESGEFVQWEVAYQRFLRCFASAAQRARGELIRAGIVEIDFLAIAIDEGEDVDPGQEIEPSRA